MCDRSLVFLRPVYSHFPSESAHLIVGSEDQGLGPIVDTPQTRPAVRSSGNDDGEEEGNTHPKQGGTSFFLRSPRPLATASHLQVFTLFNDKENRHTYTFTAAPADTPRLSRMTPILFSMSYSDTRSCCYPPLSVPRARLRQTSCGIDSPPCAPPMCLKLGARIDSGEFERCP
jgi:hypothetical protein